MQVRLTGGVPGEVLLDLDTADLPLDGNLYFVLPDGSDFSLWFHDGKVTLGAYREETEEWTTAEGGEIDLSTLPENPRAAW